MTEAGQTIPLKKPINRVDDILPESRDGPGLGHPGGAKVDAPSRSARGAGGTGVRETTGGARPEGGGPLGDVAAAAVKGNAGARSMGLDLTSGIVPAAGTPTFDLGPDEVEVGIGIHGEPGRRREKLASV